MYNEKTRFLLGRDARRGEVNETFSNAYVDRR